MRFAAGILLVAGGVSVQAQGPQAASDGAVLQAACDAPGFATTLQPVAADAAVPARAIWLSGSLIQWPGTPAPGRFVLAASAAGALVARPGEPLAGADEELVLTASTAPLAPALADRKSVV